MSFHQLTTETIAIQPKQKYEELTELFRHVSTLYLNKQLTVKELTIADSKMDDLIKKLFNINAMTSLGTNASEAYAICDPVNTRHVFTPAEYKSVLDSTEQGIERGTTLSLLADGMPGIVDLRNAKLDGAFSKVISYIVIDVPSLLAVGITDPEQLTAILLHELGHVFTYFTYCANTASINQVLMGYVTSTADPTTTMRKLSYQLLDTVSLNRDALNSMAKTNNRFVFTWRLSKAVYMHHASHASHNIYDNTSAESLADNFTARCGYGTQLVTALITLMQKKPSKKAPLSKVFSSDLSSSSMAVIKELSANLWNSADNTFISKVATKVGATLVMVGLTTSLITMNIRNMLSDDKPNDSIYPPGMLRYDNLEQRVFRIRQLVVYKLKGKPSPIHKLVLSELALLDAQLPPKSMWDSFKGVSKWVNLLLLDEDKNQIILEQALAKVVSNDLLVASSTSLSQLENP